MLRAVAGPDRQEEIKDQSMRIPAKDLDLRNIEQLIEVNAGNRTVTGTLSCLIRTPYAIELVIGGSEKVTVGFEDEVDIYRGTLLAHLVRREKLEQENGGILSEQDLQDIESMLDPLFELLTGARAGCQPPPDRPSSKTSDGTTGPHPVSATVLPTKKARSLYPTPLEIANQR